MRQIRLVPEDATQLSAQSAPNAIRKASVLSLLAITSPTKIYL